MISLTKLNDEDRDWLTALSEKKPLATDGGTMVVVAAEKPSPKVKKILGKFTIEGPLETIHLCPPNLMRDQIGGTCMLYARIHWLDISGDYTNTPDIYKIINLAPPSAPWTARAYREGLVSVFTDHQP